MFIHDLMSLYAASLRRPDFLTRLPGTLTHPEHKVKREIQGLVREILDKRAAQMMADSFLIVSPGARTGTGTPVGMQLLGRHDALRDSLDQEGALIA